MENQRTSIPTYFENHRHESGNRPNTQTFTVYPKPYVSPRGCSTLPGNPRVSKPTGLLNRVSLRPNIANAFNMFRRRPIVGHGKSVSDLMGLTRSFCPQTCFGSSYPAHFVLKRISHRVTPFISFSNVFSHRVNPLVLFSTQKKKKPQVNG